MIYYSRHIDRIPSGRKPSFHLSKETKQKITTAKKETLDLIKNCQKIAEKKARE